MKKIIIMFGAPGSGKGTQSKLIAEKYGYRHVSTGDLFRALESDPQVDPQDKKAVAIIKEGKLAPSWLVYKLAFKAVEEGVKKNGGVVLDGAVRSVEQAEKFDQFFSDHGWEEDVQAIALRLSDEEAFIRLTKRKICDKCGDIVTWDKKLDKVSVCKKCGGSLVVREDDNPEAARHRLETQGNKKLEPILGYYRKDGRLAGLDGAKNIKQVTQKISFILEHYHLWRLLRPVKKLTRFFKGVK